MAYGALPAVPLTLIGKKEFTLTDGERRDEKEKGFKREREEKGRIKHGEIDTGRK